ncbi:uncharacterized protein METZ01_LOCUS317256, partial [marine metagenome]
RRSLQTMRCLSNGQITLILMQGGLRGN